MRSGSTAYRTTCRRNRSTGSMASARFGSGRARPAPGENLLLVASDYEQPFGEFTGSLPLAGELRTGWGVMERHRVRW